jgi:hypothetical protein
VSAHFFAGAGRCALAGAATGLRPSAVRAARMRGPHAGGARHALVRLDAIRETSPTPAGT